MDNSAEKIAVEKAKNFIQEVNKAAYLDIFLLSNQVLSKNPFTNNFFRRYVNNVDACPTSALKMFFKLACYYYKSFKKFVLYLMEFIIYRLNQVNFRPSPNENELILVDTFFILEKIKMSNNYSDTYFWD